MEHKITPLKSARESVQIGGYAGPPASSCPISPESHRPAASAFSGHVDSGRALLNARRQGRSNLGRVVHNFPTADHSDKHARVRLLSLHTGIGNAFPGTVIDSQSARGRIRWYRID